MPRRFVGIDPGPVLSGLVVLDPSRGVTLAQVLDNRDVLRWITAARVYKPDDGLAVEWVSSFGMPVGREVFETCLWAGRFLQAWPYPEDVTLIPRKEVKLALCGSSVAKDANVRQALLDLFPATGGGNVPQIGIKSHPGPLYGIGTHGWSALAVAVVASWREAARDGHPTPLYASPTPIEQLCTEAIPTAHDVAVEAERVAEEQRRAKELAEKNKRPIPRNLRFQA